MTKIGLRVSKRGYYYKIVFHTFSPLTGFINHINKMTTCLKLRFGNPISATTIVCKKITFQQPTIIIIYRRWNSNAIKVWFKPNLQRRRKFFDSYASDNIPENWLLECSRKWSESEKYLYSSTNAALFKRISD